MITTPVTIGLQESQYTVTESEDYQFVCAEVQSGDVAGRDIEIDFVIDDSGIVSMSQVVLKCYIVKQAYLVILLRFFFDEHCTYRNSLCDSKYAHKNGSSNIRSTTIFILVYITHFTRWSYDSEWKSAVQ